MSGNERAPRRLGRSLLALLTGFLVVAILSVASDAAMRAAGVLPALGQPPSDTSLAIALGYRAAYSILGSYLVARLAPYRPMQHALISGLLGVVLSAVGVIATWNGGAEYGAKWYPLALVVVAMPTAWIGGKLRGEEPDKLAR